MVALKASFNILGVAKLDFQNKIWSSWSCCIWWGESRVVFAVVVKVGSGRTKVMTSHDVKCPVAARQ